MRLLNLFLIGGVLTFPVIDTTVSKSLSSLSSAFSRIARQAQPSPVNKVRVKKDLRAAAQASTWRQSFPEPSRSQPPTRPRSNSAKTKELPYYKEKKRNRKNLNLLDLMYGGDDHPDQYVKGGRARRSTPVTFAPAKLEPAILRGTFERTKYPCGIEYTGKLTETDQCQENILVN
ncbi:hypothetical protein DSO57_1017484 [Entomophthora muscae]|uniref:Uncharacterized protein n=1 Tax=Entomophthora muscae TaxID=34485 RepID=A0ACC2RVT3_9FUNG|nr:hypothetical protein DSO57_1017484 [Entomophthora muscae]